MYNHESSINLGRVPSFPVAMLKDLIRRLGPAPATNLRSWDLCHSATDRLHHCEIPGLGYPLVI